ncbi:hypothetical protein BDF22DRAFT_756771 [Syncephalis plumigaleata]|nr:hypothetical protein BDF22DRAFT_756771 [Syncephalis plumigaleata]
MNSQQSQGQAGQRQKPRRQSLDLIDTGRRGSEEGPSYAIDLQDHTGVIEDRTHVDTHAYKTGFYERSAGGKDAMTGAGSEPAISQRIADKSSHGDDTQGASTHQLSTSPDDVSDQNSSVFNLRSGATSQTDAKGETQEERISEGLRQHAIDNSDRDSVPLMFNQDGSRHEPFNVRIPAEDAQCFKDAGYFGAGVCGHSADEKAFAHPLSSTGRRRESVMLTRMEEDNLNRPHSDGDERPFDFEEQPLTEEPERYDINK